MEKYNDELLNFIDENTDFQIISNGQYIFAEAFYISDDSHPNEKRKLMIRSYSIDKINHSGLRTAKLKSYSTSKSKNPHTKKEGLPITFNKNSNGKWVWDIGFKTSKEKKDAINELNKNDIKFLNNIIASGGEDFEKYWNLNIEDKDEIKEIENKYKK